MSHSETRKRLKIAEEYALEIAAAMCGACKEIYVFGSVAKGSAKEHSDIDILLVIERPTKEEIELWNYDFVELEKHNYVRTFAKNSHLIHILRNELELKHHIPLSINCRYEDSDHILGYSEILFKDVVSGAIRIR